jgi:type I restriction enzyme R subunit
LQHEKITRKNIIDKKLSEAGWNISDTSRVIVEFSLKNKTEDAISDTEIEYSQRGYCDYVLLGKNGKPLAVIEAKKSSSDAAIGREQAKQYCYDIKNTTGELPFCFYTNGNEIYFYDLENYPPIRIHGFPTREDLERYKHLRSFRKPLSGEFINTNIAGRDYQVTAIRSIMEAIEKKRRSFLLVMATGTGKTRTCIALIDALMRAGWIERTLFLVDRVALQEQALDAFKEHLPNEPRWPQKDETGISLDRRIYVTTYNTMLNIIRSSGNQLSSHFFDLVVVDESHRSIYNTYKEILDYFHTITLGLTATPTNVIDHNTFELFECEDGLPTFAYTYEEAITNVPPYLCDFGVIKIKTKFQDEGISKRTISLEDQKKMLIEGKEIEELNFENTDLEKKVTNKGTNVLIVREFMEECIKDANGVLPGKTIFFCSSIPHARRVEKIFDDLYPEYVGDLARVIVSEDTEVYGKGGLLDQFKNTDMPRIAISVDMLDTGVDIREVTNLVFAKPVYSYTKFWQMIGRGTRLLEKEKIKPWCTEKDSFLILDCWDNFEYFKVIPEGKELKQQVPLPVRLFGLRLEKIESAKILNQTEILESEIVKLRKQISGLPGQSIVIKDASAALQKVSVDSFWENLSDEKFEFLKKAVKPLFRTVSGADFKAMRFEKDILEASLAHLRNEKEKYIQLAAGIREEIEQLPLTVNIVAREEKLIRENITEKYWKDFKEQKMDELTLKLGPLMKFRDSISKSAIVHLNLKDELISKEIVEFGPQHESLSLTAYKKMLEEKIQDLLNSSTVLQKLKAGKEITEKEAELLADQLQNEDSRINLDVLKRVYNNKKAKFIQFIKHVLGIEKLETFPEIVSKAFSEFIAEHSYLSSRQLQFLDILKKYLIEKQKIEKKNLIEAPFIHIHPEGIRGIFSPKEIEEILNLSQRVTAA